MVAEPEFTWSTFPISDLEIHLCQASRHVDCGIPASTFNIIWERNEENLALSSVLNGWFACTDCVQEMKVLWEQDVERSAKKASTTGKRRDRGR